MIDTRRATLDDASALATLNDEFNATSTTAEDIRRRFGQTGGHELVFIAIQDTQAIGFLCARIHRSICYENPMAELTEVYVREACRRCGVAKALIARAELDLRAENVSEIKVETGSDNEAAAGLYVSAGYLPAEDRILVKKLG